MTIMTIKSLWLQPWTANRVKQTETNLDFIKHTNNGPCLWSAPLYRRSHKGFCSLDVPAQTPPRIWHPSQVLWLLPPHKVYVLAYCWWPRAKSDLTEWKREKEKQKSLSPTIGLPTLRSFRGVQPNSNQETLCQSARGERNIPNLQVPARYVAAAVIERNPSRISHSIGASVHATWVQFALVFYGIEWMHLTELLHTDFRFTW